MAKVAPIEIMSPEKPSTSMNNHLEGITSSLVGKSVLIVSCSSIQNHTLPISLIEHGMEVADCKWNNCLEAFQEKRFDLVIVGLLRPRGDKKTRYNRLIQAGKTLHQHMISNRSVPMLAHLSEMEIPKVRFFFKKKIGI